MIYRREVRPMASEAGQKSLESEPAAEFALDSGMPVFARIFGQNIYRNASQLASLGRRPSRY